MASSEAALLPLFVGKRGSNVTFVLDVSEDMEAALGSVKRLLVQTLLNKASVRDSLFNIVTFSGKVCCWSHHMLPCAPDTVYTALSWIRSISCSPGRDLPAALSLALRDPACHAVHLLCTDPPEPDRPRALPRALPGLAGGRPVNVFYLQASGGPDRDARDYLQSLSRATGGSCYVVPAGLDGVLEKVIPDAVNSQSPVSTLVTCCCPSASVPSPLLRCSLGNPVRSAASCRPSVQTLDSPQFYPGCRALSRRQLDGLYYLSTVIEKVQGCRGVWVIEFDHPGGPGPVPVASRRQLVCSLDMVARTPAHALRLVPGDAVLSPWQPDLRRYGPGRVLAATRTTDDSGVLCCLRVLMWDGSVTLVSGGLVWPISASHHDRVVRELHYGYYGDWRSSLSSRCCCTGSPSCRSKSRSSCDRTEFTDTDVRRSHPDVPSSSSSSSSSEDETRATSPPVVKTQTQRPPWRYWRRTGPEPQHRQPGGAVTTRTPQSVTFSVSVPQSSGSSNHSSLFLSLPGTKGRRGNVKDVFQFKAS